MSHQTAMFRFTLGSDQSIGPSDLKRLWSRACGTPNVSVGRSQGLYPADRPTYSLYAPQHLENLPEVEQRLRRMLEESNLRASLIPAYHK
ncbi:hypothetical protein [Marilutibacter alkalisoli]|uniref:Uncharacterized protein n=1 Tax=Marilutibacter alkalisoli TaxID=2591633 RepID=A0A514BSE7_9GAMM|nr:hypothetical protein [Lysobacter alkalisoli]QDH70297.1 hypothetical protein FKV23_09505 [Lysobacter alkalisoli]